MASEKDRLGAKLRGVEAARGTMGRSAGWGPMKRVRDKLEKSMQCHDRKRTLVPHKLGEVSMLVCLDGDGAWVEGPEFEKLAKSVK